MPIRRNRRSGLQQMFKQTHAELKEAVDMHDAQSILEAVQAVDGFKDLLKDRTTPYKRVTYKQCFEGAEMVSFLLASGLGAFDSRDKATAALEHLLHAGLLSHVEDEHKFKDEAMWYEFHVEQPAEEKLEETLAGEKNVKRSDVVWKDRWRYVLMHAVLSREQSLLHLYLDKGSAPWEIIDLKGYTCEQKGEKLRLVSPQSDRMSITLATADDRDAWMHALVSAKVTLIEDMSAYTGKTFFDFKCEDIDGRDVDFSEYKGQVCLVVNVASQ